MADQQPQKLAKHPASSPESADEELLTIGALAQACGVTVRTLRYYEEVDLIGPVKRSAGKYRLYNRRSLKRVRAILALQDLNYSLEQIHEMLGSHSESQEFTKAQRIEATRKSLGLQNELIGHKLLSLQKIQDGISQRLKILNKVCDPCFLREPHVNCHNSCEYRDIHLS